MAYDFFQMRRSVFLARIASDRLRAVGESVLLFIAWAVMLVLMFVWVSLLIRGLGYVSAALMAWL
jgi:hypothetical protein